MLFLDVFNVPPATPFSRMLRAIIKQSLLQGDPFGRGKVFVEIKFTVPFHYKPLVLNCKKIAVNKSCSTTMQVTLYDFLMETQLMTHLIPSRDTIE